MKYILSSLIAIFILLINNKTFSQKRATTDTVKQEKKDPWQSTFSGLKFRSIGPALVSGRIVDLAVNPKNTSEYYVASANGVYGKQPMLVLLTLRYLKTKHLFLLVVSLLIQQIQM
jgi:hypothetical protein